VTEDAAERRTTVSLSLCDPGHIEETPVGMGIWLITAALQQAEWQSAHHRLSMLLAAVQDFVLVVP
jgi:hypothetical protein